MIGRTNIATGKYKNITVDPIAIQGGSDSSQQSTARAMYFYFDFNYSI